jgi:hypothetical protein
VREVELNATYLLDPSRPSCAICEQNDYALNWQIAARMSHYLFREKQV